MQRDDPGLAVTFYDRRVVDEAKTKNDPNGKEHYKDRLYVQIKPKGDDKTVYDQPVRPEDIRRFPIAYGLYEEGGREIDGTRVSALPGLSPDVAARYQIKGVRTIEELADATDFTLANLGAQSRAHKETAQMYLENLRMKAEAAENEEGAPRTANKRGRPPKAQQKVAA